MILLHFLQETTQRRFCVLLGLFWISPGYSKSWF